MMNTKIPTIDVGIMFEKEIHFTLQGEFRDSRNDLLTGEWKVWFENGNIYLSNNLAAFQIEESFTLVPENPETTSITLHDVTIGINFHWERKEDQVFKGGLKFIIENERITAINRLSIEDYLTSVISSEMSATSSSELLKAHAVISRSWLLAQIEKNEELKSTSAGYQSFTETEDERIRWYDREDHENFDVCADDHCQRYQGITRASTKLVEQAILETFGEILSYDNKICDARFSKCCGGKVEVFENVWEPVSHPYLQKMVDNDKDPVGFNLNLKEENAAESWIFGNPEAFCNTHDKKVLSQVLNDYDQETNDFYRWKVTYKQNEISKLIYKRIGIDFGLVQDFIPIERGESGRLVKLKIVGTQKTMTIGKELEIRKALSESHLYSSAIVFDKKEIDGEIVFILKGAGWGHGVGLCQIGAAMMGDKGYVYKEILNHYFKGVKLEKRY
ncbi:MAG: SpoIID/LytB domain-containing protein [Cyclobacteriaceae bacterium]|nr:SpoIID/LytB domain-containing protein [Cyclobacteriaceae bacterium]